MKKLIGLSCCTLLFAGCAGSDDKRSTTPPIGSVVSGKTTTTAEYVEKVKQANAQQAADQASWMRSDDNR